MNFSCFLTLKLFDYGHLSAVKFPSLSRIFILKDLSAAYDFGTAASCWTLHSPSADNEHSLLIWSLHGQIFKWAPRPRWADFDWSSWLPSRVQKSFFPGCLAAHICLHLPKLCFYRPKDCEWWCSWTQWFLFAFEFFLFTHPPVYWAWTIQLRTFYRLGTICLPCLLQWMHSYYLSLFALFSSFPMHFSTLDFLRSAGLAFVRFILSFLRFDSSLIATTNPWSFWQI